MENDKKERIKNDAWLSAQEVKKFDAEWLKNLTETDKNSYFRQSSALALG